MESVSSIFFSIFLLLGSKIAAQESFAQSAESGGESR
jgi:hypothetical protein